MLVTLCSSPLFFIVVSVPPSPPRPLHHLPPPWCTPSPYHSFPSWRPPPLPHFGKFCAKGKVSRKEKKGKVPIYSKQKKARCQCIKKRKRRKGKAAPYKAIELHLGGRSFPLLDATPFPCFGIWCNILPYFRLSSFGKKNSGCCEPP